MNTRLGCLDPGLAGVCLSVGATAQTLKQQWYKNSLCSSAQLIRRRQFLFSDLSFLIFKIALFSVELLIGECVLVAEVISA